MAVRHTDSTNKTIARSVPDKHPITSSTSSDLCILDAARFAGFDHPDLLSRPNTHCDGNHWWITGHTHSTTSLARHEQHTLLFSPLSFLPLAIMSAVPAWKRLGLKLKGPSADGSPVSTPSQTTTSSAPPAARPSYRQQQPSYNSGGGQYGGYDNGTPFNKRKQQFPSSYPSSDNKRPRRDEPDFNSSKKVSFSQDTKKAGPKKPKKKKAPKPQKPKEPYDFAAVVEYLRTWHKARDNWKFNKNHQTLLIKHLYASNAIPSSDIDIFYQYISDIKGGSRQRLVDEAKDIIKKDMEAGLKGFPEGTKAEKQKLYEEILADLLKKKAEIKDETVNGNGKRSFDEVEFVLRSMDKDVQQRVVKRMRAEIIADELESSDSSESTDVTTTVSTSAATSRIVVPVTNGAADSKDAPKSKTVRRSKLRNGGADSSSSESDSDSDSESSDSDSDSDGPTPAVGAGSTSSSSDSDSDEDMTTVDRPNADASSSSSSSSDSGSDSGVAAVDDDDSGSDGDSESSDDEDA